MGTTRDDEHDSVGKWDYLTGQHDYSWGPGGVLHDSNGNTTHTPGLAERKNGVDRGLVTDYRGTLRFTTEASFAAAMTAYQFDAFGGRSDRIGEYYASPYQFGGAFGYETEAGTQDDLPGLELTYIQQRWYDPAVGRWLTPDPIGFDDGLNLYSYVDNDPVNQVDPEGEQKGNIRPRRYYGGGRSGGGMDFPRGGSGSGGRGGARMDFPRGRSRSLPQTPLCSGAPTGSAHRDFWHRQGQATFGSGTIRRLNRPGRVIFGGVEVRAVRSLAHISDGTLRKMRERGFAGWDAQGRPLDLHHLGQRPGGVLVEIPSVQHNIHNRNQHPFGNVKGAGLTPAERAVHDAFRNAYWRARAAEELGGRGVE